MVWNESISKCNLSARRSEGNGSHNRQSAKIEII